jgi:hypothetical protein
MNAHLSNLDLDELGAGYTGSRHAQDHLAGCPGCQVKLSERKRAADAVRLHPSFRMTRVALTDESRRARPRLKAPRWLLVPAVALFLLVLLPRVRSSPPESRIKGGASLSILRERGMPSGGALTTGERVVLSVEPGDHPYALVAALDGTGAVVQLWPPDARESGRVGPGATRLSPAFEVTEGNLRVYAFFSDAPLSVGAVRDALQGSLHSGAPLEQWPSPPKVPGERDRAQAWLRVEGR